jgi:hypothetical protein
MPKTKLARKMSPQLLQRILADLAADSKKAKPTMSEAERKFATVFFLSLGDNNTFANKANFSENIAVGKETAKQEDWAPYNNKELAQESAQLLGKTQKLFAAVKLADKAPKQIRGAAYNPNENKNVLAVHLNDILNQGAINRKKVSLSPTSTPEAFDQIHAQLREIRTATRDATPAQIAQAITENKANHQEYNNAIEEQQVALARADFESKRPKPLNLSDAMMEQRPALETKNSPTVSGRRSPSYFEQGLFHDVSAVKRVLKNDEDVHFFQKMEKFAVIIQHNFSAKSEETVLRKHTDSDKTNFDSKLQSDLVTIGHLLWDQRPAQVEAKSAAAIASRETVHRGIVDIMREANLIATVLELQREGPVKLASNAPSDRLAGNANSQFNFTDLLETLKSSSDINTPAQVQAMINKLDVFKAAMGYTSAPALGEKDIIPGLTEAQTEVIRKLEGDQLRLKKQEYPAEFAQITPPKPVNVLKASSDAISVPEPIEIKQTNVTPPLITPIFVPFQAPGPTGVVKASDAIVAAPEKAEYVSPPKFSVSEIIEPAVQPVVEQKIDVNEANKDDLHAGEKLDQSDLNDLPPIPEETKDDIAQELDDDNQYDNEGFAEFKDESTQEEQKDEVIEEEASLEDVVAEEENVVLPIPSTLPPINPASDPFDAIAAQMLGLENNIQVSSAEILKHQTDTDNFDIFFSNPTNIAAATGKLKDYKEQLESIHEQITQLEEQDIAIPSHITKQLNETQIAYDNLAGLIKNAQEHSIQPQELTDSDSELELEEDELQIEQNDNVVIPVTPAQQQVVLEQDAEELPEEQVTQSLFDPDAPDTESKDEQVVSTAKRKEDDDFTPVEPLVMTDFEDDEAKIIPQVPVVADNNEDDLYADDEFDQPENSNVLPPIPEETEEEIAQELDDDNQYDNEGFAEFKDESKQEEQKDEVIEEDASLEDVVAEEENVVLPIPSTLPPISVRKDIDTLSNDIIQLHLAINMSKKEIPVTQVAFDELISQYQTDIDILEARVKERDDEDITAAFEETKKDFEILKTLFKPPVNELDDVDDGFNPVDPLLITDVEDDEQKHNVLPSISEETEEDIAEELDEDNEAELPNSSTFILPSSLIIDDDLLEEESDYDDSNTSSPISSTVTSPISSRPSTPGSPTTPTSPTTSKPSDIDLKSLLDRIAQKLHIRGNVQNFQAMHHVDKMLAIEVNIEHAREIGDTDSFKNWVHHLNNLHPPIEHIAQIMATFTAELQEVFDNNPKNATPEQMALVEKYRSLDDMSHQIQEEQLTFYKMDIAAVIGPEESDQACLNRLLGAMGDKLAGQVSQAGSAIMADPSFDEKTTKMLTETTRRIGIKCVAAVPDNLTIAAKKDFIAENSAIFRTERTQTNAVRVTMTFPNDLQPHLFLVNPAQKFGLVDNTFNPTLAGATPKGWPEIVKEMLVSFAMQKIPPSEQAMKTWLTQNGSGPGGNKNYNFGGGTMFSSAESNIAKELAKVYNEKMYSPEARQKFDVMAIHQIQEWLSARGINSDNKEHMSRISVPLPSGDPAYVQSFVNVCAAMGVNPNRLPGYTVTPGSAASIQREIETQQMKDNPTMTKFSPSIENHRWRAPDTAKMQAGYTQGVLETSLHQKDQLAQSPIPAAIQITPTTTPPSRSRITGHPPPPVKTVQSLASQLHLQPARIAPESQKVDSPKSESSGPGLGGLGKAK